MKLLLPIFVVLAACSTGRVAPAEHRARVDNSSASRLHRAVPIEKVEIRIGAQRAGRSLVVRVRGVGRGHKVGGALENPNAWRVTATQQSAALRQVLSGPAKVSRAPTGAAMGDQWDIEVNFMVAFALPTQAGLVEVRVRAPGGEIGKQEISISALASASESFSSPASKSLKLLAQK